MSGKTTIFIEAYNIGAPWFIIQFKGGAPTQEVTEMITYMTVGHHAGV